MKVPLLILIAVAQPEHGAAQLVKDRLVRRDVTFANASHALQNDGLQQIEELCTELAFRDNYTISLVGNTDSVGSYTYNLDLSRRRAESVSKALIDCGVPASRIRSDARSFTAPKASNQTEKGRAINRRTGILITYHYHPVTALQPIEGLVPGATFNLRVLFKFDKAEFMPGATERLDSIAQVLKQYPDLRFELLGWSAVSDTEDNLSTRRAKAVYDHLAKTGIDPSVMRYEGMGGAGCHDPKMYPECRRVEIAIARNPYYTGDPDPRARTGPGR